jgi:hypothetical protein
VTTPSAAAAEPRAGSAALASGTVAEPSSLLLEAFELGVGYDAFVASLPADSLGWDDFRRPVALAGADLVWRELRDLRVLAIVEDWCKDSRDSLPVLAALVATSPGTVLRIVSRDEHPDLMAAYLNEGFASIPVFVFMDGSSNELARYVERPRSVARLRRADREAIARSDPRFLPVEAKPSAYPEPLRSELRDLINAYRLASLDQVTMLVASELGQVGERLLELQEQTDPSQQTTGASGTAAAPSSGAGSLAGTGSLQILDFGDDDCEVPR